MSVTIEYSGPVVSAFDLVEDLSRRGIAVEWVPPPEKRSGVIETISIAIVANGAYDVVKSVVRRALDRDTGDSFEISVTDSHPEL